MSRGPDGIARQPKTDTALFAHIAYKLERVETAELNAWATKLGIGVGADALRNAVHHATRLDGTVDRRRVVQPWLRPDWRALDFFMAVARLQLIDSELAQLDQLETDKGVVELFASGRDATAVVVYERRGDRDALKARLENFGTIADWQEVDEHRPQAIVSTFRNLAREAALRERLLAQPPLS